MSAPLAPGAELAAGYRVVAHLSRNQALDVYDLFSVGRDCRCIAKVVRPDRRDERARARLVQEAEVLLGLTHPHLVRAYELLPGPDPVLILETLTGATLGALLEEDGPLLDGDVCELGRQLASAVGYLHRCGWLHLDLKPDNVVAERGMVKVLDLSLARRPGPAGAGIGTRQYSAPEQARGGVLGPPADVWGLGAVLFEMATGDAPYAGLPAPAEQFPQLRRRPRRLAARDLLPAGLAAAIDACLELDPSARPTVDELVRVLDAHDGESFAAAA
jgi:serine/threonine protein kinase